MKIWHFLLFFLVTFLLLRFVFVFKKADCVVENISLEAGVCQRLNDYFKGKSLFFTDFENAEIWDELMSDQQFGQSYQYQDIKKNISGNVELLLVAKVPDYRIIIGDQRYLINQNDRLKNDQSNLTLPTIEFLDDKEILSQGRIDEEYHQKFLSLSVALQKYKVETQKIVWQNDQEIHLVLKDIDVILDDGKDFDYQIERLSLVLKQDSLKEELQSKNILDMRFNLPVLKE